MENCRGTIFGYGEVFAVEYVASDYFSLKPEGTNKWELIKGVFKMSPAPKTVHQRVSAELTIDIGNFCRKKKYHILEAPCDLLLGENVVQPDIMVITDKAKITELRCIGIPDLIVEIISPQAVRLDKVEKFELYEEYGLREYWIVEPSERWVEQWTLEAGKFTGLHTFHEADSIRSVVFPDLEIDLSIVW